MLFVILGVLAYWLIPAGHKIYDYIAIIMVGFFVYGPVAMIGIYALDLAPKKAAGTAAGLTGILGYVGGAVIANVGIGWAVDTFGWNGGFLVVITSCILSIVFLALTWNAKAIRVKHKTIAQDEINQIIQIEPKQIEIPQ